jgi:hypothetical protein
MIDSLREIGYDGDFNLSLIIDWIRINKKFYIWVEHGTKRKDGTLTHDLTISDGKEYSGCLRGSYLEYNDAQKKGIELFIKYIKK